jgi:maleylacetoacetate isomerase
MELFSYFRSSAVFRVRIALNLKNIDHAIHPVHLRRDGGEHLRPAFAEVNPEKLVPMLMDEGRRFTQSLAILEYLEEQHPSPALLPAEAADRAWVRAMAAYVACEIHPLNNLRVLHYLEGTLGISPEQKQAWIVYWVHTGFAALDKRLSADGKSGLCCFGDTPTFADCCLVPQVFNARRFGVSIDDYPSIARIERHLMGLDAFKRAAPGNQPDAE